MNVNITNTLIQLIEANKNKVLKKRMGSLDSAVHLVIIHIFRKNSRVHQLGHLGRGNCIMKHNCVCFLTGSL
jgi:hypothetical protein